RSKRDWSTDVCSSDLGAWAGRQIRIGSQAAESTVRDIGANPVSLEYVEAFEGLQRGTIDCTMTQLGSAASFGVPTAAPNISYLRSEDHRGGNECKPRA